MAKQRFGQKIHDLKIGFKATGKTYKELASKLGVSSRTLRRWELREKAPINLDRKAKSKLRSLDNYYVKFSKNLLDRPSFAFDLNTELLSGEHTKLLKLLDSQGIEYNDFLKNYYSKARELLGRIGDSSRDVRLSAMRVSKDGKKIKLRYRVQEIGLNIGNVKDHNYTINFADLK
jgi:transcriptional regulator with XRE-family HTH domain